VIRSACAASLRSTAIVTALAVALLVPCGAPAPFAFAGDLILLVYLFGLGRFFITSAALEPETGRPIALGYVRVAQARHCNTLAFESEGRRGTATVVDLPMRPDSA